MEIIKFDTLGLDPKILRAITEMGFEEPAQSRYFLLQ